MTSRNTAPAATALLAAAFGLLLLSVAGSLALGPSASYSVVVFSDDFESGSSSAWDGTQGPGSATVTLSAARAGRYGLRLTNSRSSSFVSLSETLPAPLVDSSIAFSVRIGNASESRQTVAEARDASRNLRMWTLSYDGEARAYRLRVYSQSSSKEITPGRVSAASDGWYRIEVQYTATATGGAQLYINGQTKSTWRVGGDHRRSADLRVVQLWNDRTSRTDVDDVRVATTPTAPGAPTAVIGTRGDGAVALTWTAPASDGGSPVTGYRITPYIGSTAQAAVLTGSAATSHTVTGLANGTAYTFTVEAVNAVGTGPASAASASVTPAGLPGAPSGVGGTAGNGAVALTWSAPASDGGSPVTGYRVTPYVGADAQTPVLTGSAATGHTVTGLENGTAYTFTVAALNAVGGGPDSAASAPVTPLGPPGPPTDVAGSPRERAVALVWTPPAADGGSTVTGYRITPYVDGAPQTPIETGAASTAHTVTGLANGTAYTFTVAASNALGPGPESAPSAPVTPAAPHTVVSLTFDDNQATQWSARDLLRGHGMRATFYVNSGLTGDTPGGWRMTWAQLHALAADGHEIAGHTLTHRDLTLLSKEEQRREVCEDRENLLARGFSPVSSFAYPYGSYAQNDVRSIVQECGYSTGRTVGGLVSAVCPTCPYGESIPPRDRLVTRTPRDIRADTTLEMMKEYVTRAEQNGGGWVQLVLHNVCDGCEEYSVSEAQLEAFLQWLEPRAASGTAVKTIGEVISSLPPPGPPGAPRDLVAYPADGGAVLSWSPPVSDGGSEITGYRVTPYLAGAPQTPVATGSAATTYTVTGLENGTEYTFRVAAINGLGTGPESDVSAPVRPRPPLEDYSHVVFADGFESGSLSAWTGSSGPGSATVEAAAAHAGGYGLRIANASGQYAVIAKTLPAPLVDSAVSFFVRIGSPSGMETVAQARDASSSAAMWSLIYDGTRHGFYFYPHRASTGTAAEIFTGRDTAPPETWIKVEIKYTATSTGGAQLYLNGHTQAAWGAVGNYTRSANLQRVQLWNDAATTAEFDDVRVATPPPPPPALPGAPTGVSGTGTNAAVALSWTAPGSDGGSAITAYRITPYVEGAAQEPVLTGSAATRHVVSGLANGTAYTFTVAAVNAAGTGPDSPPSAPVTPEAPPPPVAMAVVSRGVPAFTNDTCAGTFPARNANDDNYRSLWRSCNSAVSATTPKWLAYDLSGVPAVQRSAVAVAWFNDPMTGPYDHTVAGSAGYNIPGTYTLEVNAAPGGTAAPTEGWSVVVTVAGNTFNSRQHVVDLAGANWVRIHVTATDGSPANMDVALNMDVHDASGGTSDDWIFFGDMMAQDGLLHDTRTSASGAVVGTFAQLVNTLKPAYFPLFQNGGIAALSSTGAAQRMPGWLDLFPGRYVALSFGTNDALAAAGDPSIAGRFFTNMETMVQAVLAAGKTPVVPTVPWGRHASLQANVPVLNDQIVRLVAAYPQIVPGPDLYAFFQANQDLIASDGIRPTWDHGYAALRQEWATFAATRIYP